MPETSVPTPPAFDALSKAEQVRYLVYIAGILIWQPDHSAAFVQSTNADIDFMARPRRSPK
jgi:hypothetical protein